MGQRDRTGGVDRFGECHHLAQQFRAVLKLAAFEIEHLVPDAPHHDARMVAVPSDHLLDLFAAVIRHGHVSWTCGRAIPLVEHLVPHDDAHAIAEIE